MSIGCEDIRETLSAYADGEESHEETTAARAHLEACAACRMTIDEWQRIEDALALTIDGPVVTEQQAASRAATGSRIVRRVAAAGIAATLVGLAVAGVVLADFGGDDGAVSPAGSVGALPLVIEPKGDDRTLDEKGEPAVRPTTRPTDRPTTGSSARPPSKDMPTVTRGSNGRLMLVLRIERAWARAGETLQAGAIIRNVTREPVTFSTPADGAVDLIIRDHEGTEVHRRSHADGWAREMVTRTLQPGEQLEERFTFVAPEPAAYELTGQCLCMPEDFDPNDPRASFTKEQPSKTYPFETTPLRFATGREPR